MATIPTPNVNPDAMPWAREITTRTQQYEKDIALLRQELTNLNKSFNGNSRLVGDQQNVVINISAGKPGTIYATDYANISGWTNTYSVFDDDYVNDVEPGRISTYNITGSTNYEGYITPTEFAVGYGGVNWVTGFVGSGTAGLWRTADLTHYIKDTVSTTAVLTEMTSGLGTVQMGAGDAGQVAIVGPSYDSAKAQALSVAGKTGSDYTAGFNATSENADTRVHAFSAGADDTIIQYSKNAGLKTQIQVTYASGADKTLIIPDEDGTFATREWAIANISGGGGSVTNPIVLTKPLGGGDYVNMTLDAENAFLLEVFDSSDTLLNSYTYNWPGASGNLALVDDITALIDGTGLGVYGDTASRPDPSTLIPGYTYFDTDLEEPIWGDGTDWVTLPAEPQATRGLAANRPAAGNEGAEYYATDTNILWWDNGSAWKNRTPRVIFNANSSTGIVNGSAAISWSTPTVDTGGYWSSGAATRVTMPYAGVYRVSIEGRGNGTAGFTATATINGSAPTDQAYITASGSGAAGGAASASRTYIRTFSANDYLIYTLSATTAQTGIHNITVEYLGES